MKKAMKVLAALGMCASLLTACGGGGQESVESTSGTSGSENVSTEKETDVSEMYTVTMAYIGNEQADMAKVEFCDLYSDSTPTYINIKKIR